MDKLLSVPLFFSSLKCFQASDLRSFVITEGFSLGKSLASRHFNLLISFSKGRKKSVLRNFLGLIA